VAPGKQRGDRDSVFEHLGAQWCGDTGDGGTGHGQGRTAGSHELFFRFVCGDGVFDAFDPQLRSRVLADGEVFFTVELPALVEYLPGKGELAQVAVPCVVTAGVDSRDPASPVHYHFEASSWLADQLGTPLVEGRSTRGACSSPDQPTGVHRGYASDLREDVAHHLSRPGFRRDRSGIEKHRRPRRN
jgi:hypothetical protein